MRCKAPRTVGFLSDGKTISWSPKTYSKEYPTFQLPCSKCVFCRLEYARQWAVRCTHEAQMHDENTFITLTYSDEHLTETLQYDHFQNFIKRLRSHNPLNKISYIVAGEYGEKKTKRPHWHACIFGWSPKDGVFKEKNKNGDQLFTSETLSKLWGMGLCDFGTVTFKSAGYVARYHLKKSKTDNRRTVFKSSRNPSIGARFLEQYADDVFNCGELRLDSNTTCSIPRYYEKWLKKHWLQKWKLYVTDVKLKKILDLESRLAKANNEWELANSKRYDSLGWKKEYTKKNWEIKAILLEKKIEKLLKQNRLQQAES